MSNETNIIGSEIRYRALLRVSGLLASESDVQTALRSVSVLLSKIVEFDRIALLLVNDDGQSAQVYALESELTDSDPLIGRDFQLQDTSLALVFESQQSKFVPSLADELARVPNLLQATRLIQSSSAYMFPISSTRKRLGVLIIVNSSGRECDAQDVELMNSVSMHFATALEAALAVEEAGSYKRNLARERDRLRLILEINNHIIAYLDISELFRAASKSIRGYFDNALTGFWLFEERSNQLELSTLDSGTGFGLHENITTTILTEEDVAKMRARVAAIFGPEEIAEFPQSIAKTMRDSSIASLVCVPLVGSNGPLGIISLGSREQDAFGQNDLDLLSQIANQISLALENALAFRRVTFSCRRLEDEREYLASELQTEYNFEDIVGKSAAIKGVLEQVAIVAPTDSTVLLIGETGTGKELIARAIHNLNLRRDRTFVRLNCAAVPSGLLESELFGHEKGAFTGALAQKRGRIELAHQGSLFLDEIGDIGLELQPKLLRVLQEREFERLGSNHTIKVDTRLIAATHRDLPGMVRNGEFREDLFYRLNVVPIELPPLRSRRDDIMLIARHFLERFRKEYDVPHKELSSEALRVLCDRRWPGNVRELRNVIERAVLLARGTTIGEADVADIVRAPVPDQSGLPFPATISELSRAAARLMLDFTNGNKTDAARRLGISRPRLHRLLNDTLDEES